MNKRIAIALVVMFIMGIVWGNPKKAPEQNGATDIIKIGVALPLTGVGARDGVSSREAIKIALNNWEEKGTKYNYELIFEDTQIEPKLSAMVMNKFMNADKVNATLSIWGFSGQIFKEHNNASKNPVPNMT